MTQLPLPRNVCPLHRLGTWGSWLTTAAQKRKWSDSVSKPIAAQGFGVPRRLRGDNFSLYLELSLSSFQRPVQWLHSFLWAILWTMAYNCLLFLNPSIDLCSLILQSHFSYFSVPFDREFKNNIRDRQVILMLEPIPRTVFSRAGNQEGLLWPE